MPGEHMSGRRESSPLKNSWRRLERGPESLVGYISMTTKLHCNADKFAVAVATQASYHMIQNRLEYGYITTGEAFVFLYVKDNDPTTPYYYMVVSSEDARDDDSSFLLCSRSRWLCMATSLWARERYKTPWPDLLLKGQIYEQLASLQGMVVSVCLSSINFDILEW